MCTGCLGVIPSGECAATRALRRPEGFWCHSGGGGRRDPARAVGTPPHLRASLSRFYAGESTPAPALQQGAAGRVQRRHRVRIYAIGLCAIDRKSVV